MNPDGTWKFAWYTSTIRGIEKLQTARYYIIAADLAYPDSSSTTSLVIKKPEFYATLTPNPANTGEYVSLTGSSEKGVSYVSVEITDISGKTLRTYTSPVSASGYFNYGFHVDMQPGQYTIRVSNPSIKSPLLKVLTVIQPQKPTLAETTVSVNQGDSTLIPGPIPTALTTTQITPGTSPGTGTLSIASTPAGASVYLDSVMMGKTPVNLGNLNYGSHLVEIKSPGYLPYSVQVTVQENAPVTLSPILLKSPSSIPLSPFTALIGLILTGAIALVWRRT